MTRAKKRPDKDQPKVQIDCHFDTMMLYTSDLSNGLTPPPPLVSPLDMNLNDLS